MSSRNQHSARISSTHGHGFSLSARISSRRVSTGRASQNRDMRISSEITDGEMLTSDDEGVEVASIPNEPYRALDPN